MFRRIFMSSSGQYSRKFKISQEIILHIKHVMVMYVHTDLKMTWIWIETYGHCVYNN